MQDEKESRAKSDLWRSGPDAHTESEPEQTCPTRKATFHRAEPPEHRRRVCRCTQRLKQQQVDTTAEGKTMKVL